jgi:glycerophosphoryl diester phosphodiesterase
MTRCRRTALIFAFVLATAHTLLPESGSAATTTLKNPFRIGRTLVIPHAGGDGLYPENTMIAWDNTMAAGGDVVDIDVFLTKDSVPIAFHDGTLDRTTNGTGRVSAHTFAELLKLDAGWNFKRAGKFPFRGKDVRIPSVESVLRRFPKSLVTLDLKDQRLAVVVPVCQVLQKLNRTADVYVGIDTNEQVLEFRNKCPLIRTSGTSNERRAMRTARDTGDTTFVTKQLVSQPGYLADDGTIRITKEMLDFSHGKGIAVLTWVVDDPQDMAQLIDLGIDGIYTRRPDILVKLLRDKGQLSGR